MRFGQIAEADPADWRQVIDINLTGPYLGIRAVVPSMRKAGGGAILNISSAAGMMAFPSNAAYVASKWGVRGMTKVAALELGRENIRVNSIHPGPIRTPMTAESEFAAAIAAQAKGLAIPRIAEPLRDHAAGSVRRFRRRQLLDRFRVHRRRRPPPRPCACSG